MEVLYIGRTHTRLAVTFVFEFSGLAVYMTALIFCLLDSTQHRYREAYYSKTQQRDLDGS